MLQDVFGRRSETAVTQKDLRRCAACGEGPWESRMREWTFPKSATPGVHKPVRGRGLLTYGPNCSLEDAALLTHQRAC
jgi:hypothetical protein